jgi:serine/threonine protein kinase
LFFNLLEASVSLSVGTRLGAVEVLAVIGRGGMGKVYRARDTRLKRDVAIKTLPDEFSHDADRLSRFQREAEVLASLNHPNIAQIYGLEESDETRCIVMELVEGETLQERLKRGLIPMDEALQIAKQIAEGLEAAHEKGIIHRDLKPANVKLTSGGRVKVLDFGLAKVNEARATNLSNSPTMMSASVPGMLVGTAAYMSPEQAKGRELGKTADVWAFGCVLYEMLTGCAAFEGETIGEILGGVFKSEPDWNRLPAGLARDLRRLLARCLQKDPKRRLQDIGDARIEIEDIERGVEISDPVQSRPGRVLHWLWPGITAAAALTAIGFAYLHFHGTAPSKALPMRFSIVLPEGEQQPAENVGSQRRPENAISPDGRYIAFVAQDATGSNLWIRALDSLSAQKLDKTENASLPFWSPDSQSIAFFADEELKRVPITGGSPQTITDAPDPVGGTWFQPSGTAGVIIFASAGLLYQVPAMGGPTRPVTKLQEGESGHSFPQFLPDGQRILYQIAGQTPARPGVYVQSIGTAASDRHLLLEAGRTVFAPPGFLLYVQDGNLLARKFDAVNLKFNSDPAPIAENVNSSPNGNFTAFSAFSVSGNGVITYRSSTAGKNLLVSYSRDGKRTPMPIDLDGPIQIVLSPDNSRLALNRRAASQDIWLLDLSSGIPSRLTFGNTNDVDPVWSPDSRRLIYDARGKDNNELREIAIGAGAENPVYSPSQPLDDWTPDGKFLVFHQARTGVFSLPLSGDKAERKPQLLLQSAFTLDEFHVSPDGRWIIYGSNESGRAEVHLARFPSFTDRRQISTNGGLQPQWRGDGRELFYLSFDGKLMSHAIEPGENLKVGPSKVLFQTAAPRSASTHHYAATRDGQRFFVVEAQNTAEGDQIYVIANWTALLAQ